MGTYTATSAALNACFMWMGHANRTVSIRPYPIARLEQASIDYATIEQRTKTGEAVEAVLVSAGPIDALRKAYPNYFLDTQEFVTQIQRLIGATASVKKFRRQSFT